MHLKAILQCNSSSSEEAQLQEHKTADRDGEVVQRVTGGVEQQPRQQIAWMRDQREHWLTVPQGEGEPEQEGAGPGRRRGGAGDQQQQQQQEDLKPKQTRARGLNKEERVARRKRSLAESNKRYQEKKKNEMDGLLERLADRERELGHLFRQNLALRAKHNSLAALVRDRELSLQDVISHLSLKDPPGRLPAAAAAAGTAAGQAAAAAPGRDGRVAPFVPPAGPLVAVATGGGPFAAAMPPAAAEAVRLIASAGASAGGLAAAAPAAALAAIHAVAPSAAGAPPGAAQGPAPGTGPPQALGAILGALRLRGWPVPPEAADYVDALAAMPPPALLAQSPSPAIVGALGPAHTAFVRLLQALLARVDTVGAGGGPAAEAPSGAAADPVGLELLEATVRTHLGMLRSWSIAVGPRWWQLSDCRMDTGELQPAPVDHWMRMIAGRRANMKRLGIPSDIDRELLAVVMLFAESMGKLLTSRERLIRNLVAALAEAGDGLLAPLTHSSHEELTQHRQQQQQQGQVLRQGHQQPGQEQQRRDGQPHQPQQSQEGSGESSGDEGPLDLEETVEALNDNIQQQANHLAMLHGASALLTQRNPLLIANTFVACYPWLPNMVKSVQLSGQVYLPPVFFESGIGLSSAQVRQGAALFASMKQEEQPRQEAEQA